MANVTRKRVFLCITIFLFFLLATVMITGCNFPGLNTSQNVTAQPVPVKNSTPQPNGEQTPMDESISSQPMTLNEGQPQTQPVQVLPTAVSENLTDVEIDDILARLPALPVDETQQTDFKLPQGLVPPPRTGDTVSQPFPPSEKVSPTEKTEAGPLEVLRFSPEGEIPVAPFISVTFNQPMVPLTTIGDLSSKDVPVQIKPDLPGIWRWIGTKTLTFNYDSSLIDRLPKSTEYFVIIPAGTTSQTGGVLQKSVEWKFTTPPVKLVTHYPEGSSQPQNSLVFLSFDQRIDPASVLKTITLTANGKPVDTKLSSDSDWKSDSRISGLVKNAQEGRWMVFQASQPLPLDSDINITVGPNTPSVEGPLTSKEVQSFSFRTYSPLKVIEHGCSWGGSNCPPLTPLYIRFNNPIDEKSFQDGMLKIQPEIPGVSANIVGDTITIEGETKGRSTYSAVLSANLQDVFGQKLGKDTSLSFKIGQAEKTLVGPGQNFITLDPASKDPALSIYSINYSRLDVQIFSVKPSDWPAYIKYLQNYQQSDKNFSIPGKKVFDKTIDVKFTDDVLTETAIKLKPFMTGEFGQFIMIVKPHLGLLEKEDYWRTIQVWVQVTHIGLDAFADQNKMTIWTTNLADGSPIEGANISSDGQSLQIKSGESGLTTIDIPNEATYLTASQWSDIAILPKNINFWGNDSWQSYPVTDELRWYVFDDRKMYKPGEEVHIKGWLRRIGGSQTGDVTLATNDVNDISYSIIEPQGNEIGKGLAEVDILGGFDFTFTIPQETNLGNAQINLQGIGPLTNLSNTSYTHSFSIQEFRRPEFEVTARNDTPGPYLAGESAIAVVEAKYYAGGALPNADVTWQVSTTPSSYSPPNWSDFTFGSWTPWWINTTESFESPVGYFRKGSEKKVETFSGTTDATGTHYLKINFEKNSSARPITVSAQATVMDVNRQAWTSSTSMLVHPATLYVGLKSNRYFVEKGTPLNIEFIVTDIDGKAVEDRLVNIQASRLEWKYKNGHWVEEEVDTQKCSESSKLEPGTCTFQTPLGGSYRITATVSDEKGRINKTDLTRWVSGGKRPPARKVEQESVTLIPDKETYLPGDNAQILVQPPFSPADGVMTVSRNGFLYSEPFHIDKDTVTLQVPIKEAYLPNVHIQVDITGSTPRLDDNGKVISDAPNRTAYATGSLNLKIPPVQRELKLVATPAEKELEPGKETSVQVALSDQQGNPVQNAEVAIVVVDEAILSLTNYSLSDPVSWFYSERPSGFNATYGRSSIILADPMVLAQTTKREMMAKGGAESMDTGAPMPTMGLMPAAPIMEAAPYAAAPSTPAPIRIRSDFNPLAAFSPTAITDNNGVVSIPVKLPDNLTRYRIMAVAVSKDGKSFGIGESSLTARLPLMVRPSAPRFLNFGDQFELPIVLQNQTDADMQVSVAVRAANLDFTKSRGERLTVPARNRVEVRFPAKTSFAGKVTLQVAAVAGNFSDAATIELPVYTPATTEAFATYGVVDKGSVVQPIASPTDVYPQYGGLEINTSSTALQALTDAVIYLVSYPFECSEQLSSRILGVAALRDVLTAFEAKDMPSPADMENAIQRDITRLQSLQNSDGGFPYWRHGQESIPFNTIHAAHALQRAKLKGFDVPPEMLSQALGYLQQIESHYPAWYSQRTRWVLSSYALYVRNLMGDRDSSKAASIIDQAGLENLPLDSIGWLWTVLSDSSADSNKITAIRTLVNNRVVETAGAANFTTDYDDQNYLLLGSDRRTDAILLEALMIDNPQSDLIPKVVNGLLAHRTKGRWGSTQENVFVLLTLDRYFNTYENQTPDFVARIWLGDGYAGSQDFRGRSTERQESNIPMNYLLDQIPTNETRDLVLNKEGSGRLYYRLGLSYVPTNLTLDPLDMGFVVERKYEAIDNPDDVRRGPDGTWFIKAGAKVKVHLTMIADNRRYHVALVDPLPAGLEIINPSLAITGNEGLTTGTLMPRYSWWWHWNWFDHQNLRDERAEVFTSLLWDGVYEYSYITRATTPGEFIVPPTKAEEMYSPEVFGRSGSDKVVVE
ncbi:Ig-like domain-containing alpha-2-macroglobulin family protein [Leptolinea tardivitalis]|uniref:Alpha-2-macroglobulin n=1 Tax=Leptolinea tardivitalis TaxID=229920 RepID=A0A0P6XSC9_9CHLR|nr:Ig-like domain-containing alpha-2-macroglobulin family protein [Leptolinea tardivitalis]KPL72515.1 hypothetical protein ADM99_05155 [Leptolinea tardivitalis]GAP21193.1 large extracellular alpha-helical protein [Leptolinea tardivitalis]